MTMKNFAGCFAKNFARMMIVCAIIFVGAAQTSAQQSTQQSARETIFLGLTDQAGNSAHPAVEQAIRLELAANPNIALVGELETQRVVREIDRLNRTRAEHFIPPTFPLSDTAIVIRGMIEEPKVTVGRQWLVFGKISANISVRLFFREHNGTSSYVGEFGGSSSMRKNFILFTSPRKSVHVSAVDRSNLLARAQREMIEAVGDFARLYYTSLNAGQAATADDGADTATVAVTGDDVVVDDDDGVTAEDVNEGEE